MNVSFLQPRQELRPHIKSLWVCESALGLPATDRSLAAPNGCPKLIVPYENSDSARRHAGDHDRCQTHGAHT
jgi:hypothetical protein